MEPIDQQPEAAAIMQVIAGETAAFWNKDYEAWAEYWVHAPYSRIMGWWARGGITVVEGWDAISTRIKATLTANPEPNPTAVQVRGRISISTRLEMWPG